MSKLKLYAVRDAKADAFMALNPGTSTGSVIRSFSDGVQTPDTPFNKHPEDYALFELGTYDEETGLVEGLPQPVHIINALDCVKVD